MALMVGLATLHAPVAAQVNAPTSSPVNLKDAVERAVLQNPEVKLRFHNLEAAQQERSAAQGAWLPRIDLEVAGGRQQTLTPALASTNEYNSNRAQIQLRQTLFDGFATSSEVRRLSYAQQAAYYDFMSVSNLTALEAARAYIDVVRFRQLVELAAANFTTHQEVHDRINQKVTAGVGRRVDLEQSAGRMALAESNWLTEVSNLHDVSARYQRLVGDTPAENLARLESLSAFLPSGAGFLTDAVKKNPDFLSSISTIRAFRADLSLRKSALYPTVELRARQSVENNQSGVTGDYRDRALEVVMTYNLFRGGSDSARAKQYAAKLNSAFDLRDKTCRDVWQTGQIAVNDSVRLVNQIKLLSQHELSTSKARQAYQQQFDIGQRSLLDLLDTENELYQARRALANAEYDLELAQARVLAISGSLLPALKLRTLAEGQPDVSGGQEDIDESLACSNRLVPTPTLDRSFDSRPAPAPTPTTVAKPVPVTSKISYSADTFFDYNQSVLQPEGKTKLDELVDKIKGTNLELIIVVGHTDSKGSDAFNQKLSLRRSEAVKTYLQGKGIEADRISAQGKGKLNPVADNSTKEGQAKNRRVEIEVVGTRTSN